MIDEPSSPRYTLRPSFDGYFAIYEVTIGAIVSVNDVWLEMRTKEEAVTLIEELTRLDRKASGSTKQ